jgi:alpha-N-arabinofuranosidase
MRMDVIEKLKDTGFKGLFRYPGGCYAPFYRWKIGLLEADARPPIETPPGYCDAVAGGVNAYTDGMMENGISTDDYLALCEYTGLIPAITVRFQEGLPGPGGDVEEARQWVEYVNGGVNTPFGALRAARGHPEPYNVSYWYLLCSIVPLSPGRYALCGLGSLCTGTLCCFGLLITVVAQ